MIFVAFFLGLLCGVIACVAFMGGIIKVLYKEFKSQQEVEDGR